VVDRGRFRTTPKAIEKWFTDVSSARVAMEAGTHSIWISAQLQELGHEVIVANVRELRAISHECIAKQWFLIGPGSSGIQMKLVVNLLLGVDMQAIAEAVSLGEHLRIDRDVLLNVLSETTVIPPAFEGKFKKSRTTTILRNFRCD
jgi:NAD-binding of NADP-dependent 3-hydroxyisobutyrate dehydrogenase